MCAGATEATVQLMTLHHEVCIPEATKHIEIAKVVATYLDNHPERPDEAYGILMFRALQESWPCRQIKK
jgi:hypothetical protein